MAARESIEENRKPNLFKVGKMISGILRGYSNWGFKTALTVASSSVFFLNVVKHQEIL
jgi:hypothetical protein